MLNSKADFLLIVKHFYIFVCTLLLGIALILAINWNEPNATWVTCVLDGRTQVRRFIKGSQSVNLGNEVPFVFEPNRELYTTLDVLSSDDRIGSCGLNDEQLNSLKGIFFSIVNCIMVVQY